MNKTLAALLISLGPAIAQYGPEFVKGFIDLVHGNPQNTGESDADYITRTNGLIDAKLLDAETKDAQIEAPDQDAAPNNAGNAGTGNA